MLENGNGEYISGNDIAENLGITRAAVWKNIRQLENDGYIIEAVTNRGYRLSEENDVISEDLIRKYLGEYSEIFEIEVLKQVTSTNNVLKEKAGEASAWHTVISGSQTMGKGRMVRSFFSPSGSGIYLSMLIRLPLPAMEATRLTTASAVAACRAIEECTDQKPVIKWVNDVFVNGKKTCGILTEASVSMESGALDWAVMGIGINVYEPDGGFPEDIKNVAGAVVTKRQKNLKSRIAASFMKHYYLISSNLMDKALIDEYRSRSFLPGRSVYVIRNDKKIPAVAETIDDDCRLVVRYEDGSREALSSGEVSIKL